MLVIKRTFGPVQDRIPANPKEIHLNEEWIEGLETDPEVLLQMADDARYEYQLQMLATYKQGD